MIDVVVVVVAVVVAAVVVVVVAIVVVFDFDFDGGARVWTRQAPWYLPYGEVVRIICHEFVAYVYV